MTMNSKLETIAPNSKITRKDFWSCFFRSLTLDSSWNYERMQNIAFGYMMCPIVRRLYGDDEQKRKEALERHLEFMSVTPHICTLLVGIAGAMEEEYSKNPEMDPTSINAVKSSLMGPLAGIGDSFFWGTLKVIAAGVGIALAANGNIAGPIVFLLIINIPHFILRYICLDQGFKSGARFFNDLSNTGIIDKVTTAASMLGLMVIGGMTATNIYFELPTMIGSGEFAEPLQGYIDQIMPAFFPVVFFLLMYWLLGKKVKTTTILLAVFVICIALCGLGIL